MTKEQDNMTIRNSSVCVSEQMNKIEEYIFV